MTDDQKKSLCPMTFNIPPEETYDSTPYCVQERCAWWNEECQKCAMVILADSVRKQVKK